MLTPTGTEEREVAVGLSNDKMVEIETGLEEGDEVVLNPRVLLERQGEGAAAAATAAGGRRRHGRQGQGRQAGDGKGKRQGRRQAARAAAKAGGPGGNAGRPPWDRPG